jgi:uncharacterized protein (TIGR02996 family)
MMDLEEAFLADMVAHPHDATPWLVFADWLEERGDPRGELVRLLRLCWDEPRKKVFKARHARLQELFASGVRLPLPRFTNDLGMESVWVPPSHFWMGGGSGIPGRRKVAMKAFWIGVYPVTQGQWRAVMGSNPSEFTPQGRLSAFPGISDSDLDLFPVENVSWNDAMEFTTRLIHRYLESGWGYRLPSEEEWEYACRGPVTCRSDCAFSFHAGEPSNSLSSEQANFDGNHPVKAPIGPFLRRPSKVGSYPPNRLGIHDLHGNVYEWVHRVRDVGCVVRGGSWQYDARFCFTSAGHSEAPQSRAFNRGVRLVRCEIGD